LWFNILNPHSEWFCVSRVSRTQQAKSLEKKASEPEGSEAIIPVISLVALLYGDIETASDGIRQHQNTSSEASSRYSHSINLLFHLVHRLL